MSHEDFMKQAIALANQAASQDEIPVGCLIVDPITNTIIAQAHNLSQHTEDATSHAEIIAIRQA